MPAWRDLWKERSLFLALLERDLRNRFVGSVGGWFWPILQAVALLGVYALVFRVVFRVELPDLAGRPFVAFVAVALWPWLAFQEGVQRANVAIQNNAALVKKVAFPHELLVYSSVAAVFVVHGAGYLVAMVLLSLAGVEMSWLGIAFALLLFALLFAFAVTVGLVLSPMQVFLRDVDQALAPIFMILFYATPILYPVSMLPSWLAVLLGFNPLVHFIEPIRALALFGHFSVPLAAWLVWVAVPVAFLVARMFFLRLSPHFEDFV